MHFLIVLALLTGGCVPALMLPTTADVERANTTGYVITFEALEEAHKLYISRCGNCHFLYRPYQFTKEKWDQVMPDMKKEAKLTNQEYELLLKYVAIMQETVPGKNLNN